MNNNSVKNNNFVRSLIIILIPILLGGLIAGMSWIGNNLMNANSEINVLKTEISSLKNSIGNKTSDRYRRADATRDFNRVETRLKDIGGRLRILEIKILSK